VATPVDDHNRQSTRNDIMKKLLVTSAALALAAMAVSAADVYSSNIVGYNKLELTKLATLIAVNFDEIGATDMLINDAFPLQTGMQTGATAGAADNIQIRTLAGGYEVYFLSNGLVGKGGVLVPAVQN
jgi:hypothetical protein